MTDRPILFSAPMVRALLAGTKSQTRRVSGLEVINSDPDRYTFVGLTSGPGEPHFAFRDNDTGAQVLVRCKQGQPGDRLWVRETCRAEERASDSVDGVRYLADNSWREIENTREAADAWVALNCYHGRRGVTVPPIHMPRWASRITLEITGVRVERLKDITSDDCRAEGIERHGNETGGLYYVVEGQHYYLAKSAFIALWESINGAGSWALNPWVWVIGFKQVAA